MAWMEPGREAQVPQVEAGPAGFKRRGVAVAMAEAGAHRPTCSRCGASLGGHPPCGDVTDSEATDGDIMGIGRIAGRLDVVDPDGLQRDLKRFRSRVRIAA